MAFMETLMQSFLLIRAGEAMGVSVEVLNESTRTVTPRFYLCEKQTFAAQSKTIVHTKDILFGGGDSVPAETSQTITKVLSVPPQLPPTFFNCSMMRLEYRLKVFTKQAHFNRLSHFLSPLLNYVLMQHRTCKYSHTVMTWHKVKTPFYFKLTFRFQIIFCQM